MTDHTGRGVSPRVWCAAIALILLALTATVARAQASGHARVPTVFKEVS